MTFVIVVVTGVIVSYVVIGLTGGVRLFGLHASFIQKFLELTFTTLHVDCNAIVFRGIWGNAVSQVSRSGLTDHDIWLDQSKMGGAAALVGGGAAMTGKTHKGVAKSKNWMAAA